MLTRRLGRTGHESSVAILGGAAFWQATPSQAGPVFEAALAAGVNHLDIAPQYGEAQVAVGPHVPAVRDRLFVGCKTMRKNADGVRAQLDESLGLLGCDHFDLYQLHAVGTLEELDARADAAAAVLAARDEGLTRFAGITGHDHTAPATHLEALRRHDFDTVMFPLNPQLWSRPDYRADAEALLAECAARDVGVQIIKAGAARPWAGRERTAESWYEPYSTAAEIERGVRFVLSVEGVHAFATPGDFAVLRLALDAANAFTPMTAEEQAAAVAECAGEPDIFPLAVHAQR